MDHLFVASTQIGENDPKATVSPNMKMGSAPAIAAIAGAQLQGPTVYLVFQAENATEDLFITVSPDGGKTSPPAKQIPKVTIGGKLALHLRLQLAEQAKVSRESV